MIEILEKFDRQILTFLLVALVGVVVWLIKTYTKQLKNEISKVYKEIILTRIDVRAMDFAMQQLNNGAYIDFRDKEKKRLIEDNKFINE